MYTQCYSIFNKLCVSIFIVTNIYIYIYIYIYTQVGASERHDALEAAKARLDEARRQAGLREVSRFIKEGCSGNRV